MDLALMIAKTGLDAHHKSIEVISNNLANANTTAFKKNRAEFEDLPYQVLKEPGVPSSSGNNSPANILIGTGAQMSNNKKIFNDGPTIITDNALDIKINGRGFLQAQLPSGGTVAYTRAGALTQNEQGQLALPNGYIVQPPISIPQGTQNVSIAQDGTVSGTQQGSTVAQTIGQITLNDFVNPEGLQPIGDNLYIETIESGAATTGTPGVNGLGLIKDKALEGSNVNVVEEMVNLIEAQRAFEVTSKAITAADNMMKNINQVV